MARPSPAPPRRSARDERGSVILMSIVLVFVMTLLGLALFDLAAIENRMSLSTQADMRAFEVAQAGLERALRELQDGFVADAAGAESWADNAERPDLRALVRHRRLPADDARQQHVPRRRQLCRRDHAGHGPRGQRDLDVSDRAQLLPERGQRVHQSRLRPQHRDGDGQSRRRRHLAGARRLHRQEDAAGAGAGPSRRPCSPTAWSPAPRAPFSP